MSNHTNNLTVITSYTSQLLAHDVGEETKDSYYLCCFYRHNIATNEITSRHELVKNYFHNVVGANGPKPNTKYKEMLLEGTPQECIYFMSYILAKEGYWDKHPTESFKQIFIKPTVIPV